MRKGLLLFGCLLPLLALADTTLTVDDVVVKGRPLFVSASQHGYTEVRFTVENHSSIRAHTVQIDLHASHNNASTTKTVSAPPNGRLEFSLFCTRSSNYFTMTATVDGRKTESASMSRSGSYGRMNITAILVSKAINQDNLQERIEELRGWTGTAKFKENYSIQRTELPPEEWSDNWLAYSAFDGVVLQQTDVDVMPENVRAALQQYVECGGALTVRNGKTCPFSGNTVQQLSYSSGKRTYTVGFGLCFMYARNAENLFRRDERAWREGQKLYQNRQNEAQINKKFRVVDQVSVPVRGFLLLVTLFALLAGPLTIFILAKTNRRIWLLWVIPLESALACGLVLGYSLFSEGITPTVRLAGLTLLDQERHVATTLGWAGYYCPQRPAKGLFFPDDWELMRVSDYRSMRGARTVDWTRGQHLSHGWVKARVPSFFMCRRNTIRRERLECSLNADGKMEVVNGLGANISSLWLCDDKGQLHVAQQVKAGQRVALEAQNKEGGARTLVRLRQHFTSDFKEAKNALTQDPQPYMIPGSYVAVLDGSPFMEHGLGEKKINLTASSVVYGILPMEEQP
jgi:hypothetical protein